MSGILFADWSIDSLILNASVPYDVIVRADLLVRNDHVWNPSRTDLYPIFTYIPRKFLEFWPPNFTDSIIDDLSPRVEFRRWLKTHRFTFIM